MVGTLRILLFLATVTQLLLALISAKSVAKPSHQAQFVDYLKKYGYMPEADPRLGEMNTDKDLREGVKKIQRLFNLPPTGDLSDPQTVAIMHKTRCGMPDFGPSDNARRKRRYATHGTVWNKTDLTYKIVNYTPDLKKQEVDQTIDKAIAMWADVSSLSLKKVTDADKEADILLKFVQGYHGDSRPADGKGKELAHAFFPLDNTGLAGDVHFDEGETYTLLDMEPDGVDLLWLAGHELGHSLGLDHAYHPDSIMFPFYIGYTKNLKLGTDDKNGIQSLYGMPTIERVTPTPHIQATPAPDLPDKCSAKVDAIVTTQDKTTLMFSGEHFWEIGDHGAGEVRKIKDVYHDLEENIDAAYTSRKEGHTVFFKGTRFWVYENRKHIYGPASIEEVGIPPELANMDAVLEWGRNGKTYFFKGNQYWRFDPNRKSVDSGYPRNIGNAWRGIPESNLDGAFQWKNGKTYFFKGNNYYALDDYRVRVKPGYPRDVATYWMGCGSNGDGKLAPVNSGFSCAPSFVLFAVTLFLAWLF